MRSTYFMTQLPFSRIMSKPAAAHVAIASTTIGSSCYCSTVATTLNNSIVTVATLFSSTITTLQLLLNLFSVTSIEESPKP